MRGPRSRQTLTAGFTIIELIVTMVVMGVLAAVAMPRLTDRRALDERAAADRVAGVLRQARTMAMAQRRDICALLAPPAVRLVYAPGAACDPLRPVADPLGVGALAVPIPGDVPVSGPLQLRFDARGRPVPNLPALLSVGNIALTVQRETGMVR